MRWSRLLLPVVALVLSACGIFGSPAPQLPPVMPPNFTLGLQVLEATAPPVDYLVKLNRSGRVTYDTTVRVPRHRRSQGELELGEAQVVRLYDAVQAAGYDGLAMEYSAEEGSASRRENGQRIFYVVAGDVDKRIVARYAAVPELDALQAAIVDVLPKYVFTGEGAPGNVRDRPDGFVGDRRTRAFHHPDCDLLEGLPVKDRDTYSNEYDALNFGFHPCEVCRPLETRK